MDAANDLRRIVSAGAGYSSSTYPEELTKGGPVWERPRKYRSGF
jgi:hypothetical protein